jgi:hypothetical protein
MTSARRGRITASTRVCSVFSRAPENRRFPRQAPVVQLGETDLSQTYYVIIAEWLRRLG